MVGQCVEESFERHRMIPGRMTFTVQDQAFPWDADSEKDPNFGAFFLTPSKTTAPLPPYRPALLARQIDNFLCQINSLPTKVPPVLCAFDPRRRLRLPTKEFLLFWESLIDQPGEQQAVHALVQNVIPGVGTRIGTQVYRQYLGHALNGFEDLILGVSEMLKSIEDAEFPDEMCRRNTDNP